MVLGLLIFSQRVGCRCSVVCYCCLCFDDEQYITLLATSIDVSSLRRLNRKLSHRVNENQSLLQPLNIIHFKEIMKLGMRLRKVTWCFVFLQRLAHATGLVGDDPSQMHTIGKTEGCVSLNGRRSLVGKGHFGLFVFAIP
jgi:hypothetical protein